MDSSSGQAAGGPGGAALAEVFRARHERLRGVLAGRRLDALVVAHLPNITYLSGFRGSAGLLVVTPGRLYLLVDFRYSAAVARAAEIGALASDLDVIEVDGSYDRRLVGWLSDWSADKKGERLGFEAAHVSVARYEWWQRELGTRPVGPVEWVRVEGAVEDGRQIKDAHEIGIVREAGRRLSAVARDVLDEVVRPGRIEIAIAADIDWRLRQAGFEKPAFDTIVAAGPNAALPHAVPTGRPVSGGDLVLLDFGGVYSGYCVDLTRTVGLGAIPPESRRLFDAVLDAHAAALAAAGRPGVTTGEVDAAARDLLASRGLGDRFGHGTGHGLGLEIHEAPRLARRTTDHPGETPLTAGMIFTIEPGAYVPGLGGVRIEDDVLVTPEGCELLTDAPRAWREL